VGVEVEPLPATSSPWKYWWVVALLGKQGILLVAVRVREISR